MSGIPGSRVAGIGPTPQRTRLVPYGIPGVTPSGVFVTLVDEPHHAACRERTPEEQEAIQEIELRRDLESVERIRARRRSAQVADNARRTIQKKETAA